MKKFLIALVLVVIGATLMVNAQQSLGQVASGPSVPSGACGNGSLYTVTGTGALYSCNAGSWALVSGGGGSTTFANIPGGTNTSSTMTVGSGASLGASGSGAITATKISPPGTSGNCVQWGTSGALADAGAACGSGGGGTSPVTTGQFTISSAQILLSSATPVTLVAAPGASKYFRINFVDVQYKYNTVDYTPSGNLFVSLGTNSSAAFRAVQNSIFGNAASVVDQLESPQLNVGSDFGDFQSNFANMPIQFFSDTAPTGGNGTLIITVTYQTITLQ